MDMDICFVLVAPAVPENVGAAARALKTMGFSRLRLVRGVSLQEKSALWMAHGARDILDAAQTFDSLEEALADRDFSIATTARRRGMKHEYYPPRDLPSLLREKSTGNLRAAVVFGCEESGLSNRDILLCDCVSSVPLAAAYPSLNLAQALMIYAYELSPLAGILAAPDAHSGSPHETRRTETGPRNQDTPSFQALKKRAANLLARMEPAGDLVSRRVLERLGALRQEDISLAHSLCAKIEKRLE
ncbi:MAG: tRNA/rRNA methyltransferase [Spirochaetales bacterium]|jgi:tRNA/rRNA methyltransferase|nr:tRNA/rRNA methyltransferase [Spirochaetales bacterium]